MESVALGIGGTVLRDQIIVFTHTIFDVCIWSGKFTLPFSPVSNFPVVEEVPL